MGDSIDIVASNAQAARELTDRIALYEAYFDRLLVKMKEAKADLDRCWLGQTTGILLSLALIAGLGSIAAKKLFDDPDRYGILYLLLPAYNTFMFVRFGLIGGTFSKARFQAEALAKAIRPHRSLPKGVEIGELVQTNSYFEWAHQHYSRATFAFLMTVPLTFSANHALTLYMLYKLLGVDIWFWMIAVVYAAICATCYWQYYLSNRENTPVLPNKPGNFIIVTTVIALVATLALLYTIHRFDPQPHAIASPFGPDREISVHASHRRSSDQ